MMPRTQKQALAFLGRVSKYVGMLPRNEGTREALSKLFRAHSEIEIELRAGYVGEGRALNPHLGERKEEGR